MTRFKALAGLAIGLMIVLPAVLVVRWALRDELARFGSPDQGKAGWR